MSGAAASSRPRLTDPFRIGDVEIANRVLLAPLAGIGNWFVRIQARRHGAGLAVSEMVSSHAIHYRNERTMRELLVIRPDEHPVSIQLFGSEPDVMRGAAAVVAEAGADIVDLNMGCPVKKVRKTGAGAELISDPDLAVAVAAAAVEGAAGRPVTVKIRSGLVAGDTSGVDVGRRLVEDAGVAAIALHPRPAAIGHKGKPDYALVGALKALVDVPVIVSGGLRDAERARQAYEISGADAVMIARGSFGYPWIFEELTGARTDPPTREEIATELLWVMDRAEEHFGERACRYLRKFYPWYLERLGATKAQTHAFQTVEALDEARAMVGELVPGGPVAHASQALARVG